MPDPLNENRPRERRPERHAGRRLRADRRDARRLEGAGRHRRRASRGVDLDVEADRCPRTAPSTRSGSTRCAPSPSSATSRWGARTLDGADQQASEWKYIPVRRTALYIEESLYQGLKWVVFEPNDEPLWSQIRLNVGAFMHDLFRQGAFQGATPTRGVLRQVRRRDDHADRHRPGDREHPRRLRAAQAGRVRRHQDPADRRPDRDLEEDAAWPDSASTQTASIRTRTSSSGVKWDGRYVAGVSKVERAQAHDRGRQAPRGRRPSTSSRKSPGRTEVRGDHARARRHARPRVRELGEQGLELRRRPRRRGLAQGLPQGHHHRGLQRGRPDGRSPTTSTAAGSRSSRRCRTWTPTRTPSRSRRSSSRTRAGSATRTSPSRRRP